jgi:hypothetical protein
VPAPTRRTALDVVIALAVAALAVLVWKLRIIDPATVEYHILANQDFFTQIYPMSHRAAEWIRAGTLPLWNPYQYCGLPFLATGLYGVLYPPNALYLVLPTAVAIEVIIVLHLATSGVLTYAFARVMGLSHTAATLAATTFMLSGFMVAQAAWFPPAIGAATWLPLALIAVERLIATRRAYWSVVLAVAVALSFLAGWPQTWLYAMWALAGFVAVRLSTLAITRRGHRREVAAVALLVAAGLLIGGGLMAAQLLPGLELQGLGPRRVGGLSLRQAVALAPAPDVVRAQMVDSQAGHPRLVYVGMLALLVIPVALFTRACTRVRTLYFFALGLFSVGVVLSVYTPLFALYRLVPGSAWFRAPPRLLYLYAFAAAVLSGVGLDVIARAEPLPARRPVGVLALVTSVGVWLALAVAMPEQSRVYVAIGVGLVWVAVAARPRVARRLAVIAIVAVAGWDLFHSVSNPYFHPFHQPETFDREAPLLDFIHSHQGLGRTYFDLLLETPQMMSKQGSLRGIYAITDYEPLSVARYDRFYRLLERESDRRPDIVTFTGHLHAHPDAPLFPLIDLLSLRYIVLQRGLVDYERGLARDPGKWRPVPSIRSSYVLYENTDMLPRAYVAHRAIPAGNEDEALAAVSGATFDPRRDVVIEDITLSETPLTGAIPLITAAKIVDYEPSRVVVEANILFAGHLVLTDTFYPGWRAELDGQPAEIERANFLFRAVAIPAGHHTITFQYAPRSFRVGAAITIATLLLTVVVVGVSLSGAGRRSAPARE